MGFLDKMKGAVSAITGGGANVSIEFPHEALTPGEPIPVKVTVVSTGGEIKSEGVYVDVLAQEVGSLRKKFVCDGCEKDHEIDIDLRKKTYEQSFPISPAFTLQPDESKTFEGQIQLPGDARPTYKGQVAHQWSMQGRLEAFGNDPDSGYQPFRVGVK